MKTIKTGWRSIVGLLLISAFSAVAVTVYVEPNRSHFDPDGSWGYPWSTLQPGIAAAQGGTVVIKGSSSIYGTMRITNTSLAASPVRLTRDPNHPPVRIGAAPVAQTSFRCISYNCRLGKPAGPDADDETESRANAVQNYNWGDWDAFGFSELWSYFECYMPFIRQMSLGNDYQIDAFDYASGTFQHGGLLLYTKRPISQRHRGVFSDAANGSEDALASKGWVRCRIEKDGIGIWLYVTHTQADAVSPLTTWSQIYSARENQLKEIRDDVLLLRHGSPLFGIPGVASNDVFIVMGDFNVYGENREPLGPDIDLYNEYDRFAWVLGPQLGSRQGALVPGVSGMDVAKHFFPKRTEYTFDWRNSEARYFYPSLTEQESARLDYFIALNSADGKVIIEPTDYEVLNPTGASTGRELSDHYPIAATFRITRIAN